MRHQTVKTVRSCAAMMLLALAGCGRHVQYDYYDFDMQKPLDYLQLAFKSSHVVVARVRSVEVTRTGVPARKAPEFLLDETKVDLDVENILRGDWPHARLPFKFFAYSMKNRGGYTGPELYRVKEGERRIFFLTRDEGEFRSVADVRGDYSVRVWSGMHRNFRRSEPATDAMEYARDPALLGSDVAAILLDVGEGYDAEAMAATLARPLYVSDQLASRKVTVSHLQKLSTGAHSAVLRVAACEILAEQYAGQSGCLYAMENDSSLLPADQKRIREMLAKRKQWDARLKQVLRTRPMSAFDLISVAAVRDEFELLLSDPDPELRELGCEALRHCYGRLERECSPAR